MPSLNDHDFDTLSPLGACPHCGADVSDLGGLTRSAPYLPCDVWPVVYVGAAWHFGCLIRERHVPGDPEDPGFALIDAGLALQRQRASERAGELPLRAFIRLA